MSDLDVKTALNTAVTKAVNRETKEILEQTNLKTKPSEEKIEELKKLMSDELTNIGEELVRKFDAVESA